MADLTPQALLRWSEALAGIARTGLGFTDNPYEAERFDEILHIAADIGVAAGRSYSTDELVEEWMKHVGRGVPGYQTPKVGIGAVVGNDAGEILLINAVLSHVAARGAVAPVKIGESLATPA